MTQFSLNNLGIYGIWNKDDKAFNIRSYGKALH